MMLESAGLRMESDLMQHCNEFCFELTKPWNDESGLYESDAGENRRTQTQTSEANGLWREDKLFLNDIKSPILTHSRSPSLTDSTESDPNSLLHSALGLDDWNIAGDEITSSETDVISNIEENLSSIDDYVHISDSSLFSQLSALNDVISKSFHEKGTCDKDRNGRRESSQNLTCPPIPTTSTSNILPSSLNTNILKRPDSLNLSKLSNRLPTTQSVLTSPNTNDAIRLEEQLASADNAWFGALDLPSVGSEDMDFLLRATNCLQSPTSGISQAKTPCALTPECFQSVNTVASQRTHEQLAGTSTDLSCPVLPGAAEKQTVSHSTVTQITEEDMNSDDTITCSEAEYHKQQLELREKRKRVRARRRFDHRIRWEFQPESDDSDFEEPIGKCQSTTRQEHVEPNRNTTKNGHSASRRRHQSIRADAELQAWWPKNTPILYEASVESDGQSRSKLCTEDVTSSSKPIVRIYTDDSGHESDSTASNIKNQTHTCPRKRIGKRPGEDCSAPRKRRQLELWQFVLCRLETARNSSFQWVNRSSGVFRILDTHAAAREWGRYRHNSRMDYEKMARAMRFYYKDSILRKAHQQLHFQFAMPCVNWAEKVYHRR